MRLICPSCGAQYEVDESVIPDAGRDVQCSNCGNAWFQMSAAQLRAQDDAAAAASEATATAPEGTEEWTEAEAEAEAEAPAEADAEATASDLIEEVADPAPAPVPEPAEPEPAPVPVEPEPAAARTEPEPKRKTLDDAVMNVLREEAARERRAREAEGGPVPVEPEAAAIAAVAATAIAAAGSVPENDDDISREEFGDDDAVISRASRRELLPDIEEINSTLRATSDRGGEAASMDAPETLRRRRSGFRMGFSTAIVIAALLLLLYVLAPAIAARVPATEAVLQGYVGAIDGFRGWLDGTLRGLTASMTDGQS